MEDRSLLYVTLTFLLAGLLLVGAGTAGLGGLPFLGVGLVLTAAFYYVGWRQPLERLSWVDEYVDRRAILAGVALATGVSAVWFGSSPGELQTLGGVLGLVGMFNYFMRPVYQAIGTRIRGQRR